eukprot:SAG31_NODE_49452_length_139_cov_15.175000_1_plen_29_part_01
MESADTFFEILRFSEIKRTVIDSIRLRAS